MKWRAIRSPEGQHTVVPTNDGESAFVNGAMVTATQQHEVVEARRASIGPVIYMMSIAPAGGAAWKATPGVAGGERAADRRWNRARLAAHVDHGTVGVVAHGHQRGVAGQTPRRFRRNVHRAVVDFECTIEDVRCRGDHGRCRGRVPADTRLGSAAPGLGSAHVCAATIRSAAQRQLDLPLRVGRLDCASL